MRWVGGPPSCRLYQIGRLSYPFYPVCLGLFTSTPPFLRPFAGSTMLVRRSWMRALDARLQACSSSMTWPVSAAP
jgi:hypothetical protein